MYVGMYVCHFRTRMNLTEKKEGKKTSKSAREDGSFRHAPLASTLFNAPINCNVRRVYENRFPVLALRCFGML